MNLEERLLCMMRESDYMPGGITEISRSLKLDKKEALHLRKTLQRLAKDGIISRNKESKYCISNNPDLISGIIYFRQSGSATVVPDNPSAIEFDSIDIRSRKTDIAFHKDHVLVKVLRPRQKTEFKRGRRIIKNETQDRLFGQVIRVLKSNNTHIVGTFQLSGKHYQVIPDDPRICRNILVANTEEIPLTPPAKINDKVVIELLKWENPYSNPEGKITEILGKTHTPEAEYKAILQKHHLDPGFPQAVMDELKSLPSKVRKKDIGNRMDCRKLFTITIDPDDAKDFDDALSLEALANENIRIGVHIADVNAYVSSGSTIDKEAAERGNSTYLVGTVIPMLPHALSNGICSLVEGEDRLTKSVFFTFDKQGQLKNTEFANCVICSNKRLTYKQAHKLLIEDDFNKIRNTPMPESHNTGSIGRPLKDISNEELNSLQKMIRQLWDIAKLIRQNRLKQGSLDLDMPDIKIYVNKEGYADRIENILYDESHQLIEEFMLVANESIARTIHEAGMPLISRIHDKPNEEKLIDLREHLISIGIQTGDLTLREEVTKLLKLLKNHPDNYLLKIQFLRSMKQACYRAENDGHYGLNKTFYTHFTSPIRRYSDLLTHRVLDHYLQRSKNKTAPTKLPQIYSKAKLSSLADHISITEQNSTEAERESVKIKLLEFFDRETKKKKKSIFQAIITDVKKNGLFIELTKSQAYGMIPISSLRDDQYSLSMDNRSIKGRRKKNVYTLGQNIEVVIESVDRFSRHINFQIAGNLPEKKPRSPEKRTNKTKRKKPRKKKRKS